MRKLSLFLTIALAALLSEANVVAAQDRKLSNEAELELRNRRETVVDSARRLIATKGLAPDKLEDGRRMYTAAQIAHNTYVDQVAAMLRRGDEAKIDELKAQHAKLPGLVDQFMQFVDKNTKVAGAFTWIAPTIEGIVKGGVEIAKFWRQRTKEDRDLKAQTFRAGTIWPEWKALNEP